MQVRAQWSLLRLPSRSLSYAKIHNIFKSKPTFTKFSFKSKPTFAKILFKSKPTFTKILFKSKPTFAKIPFKSKPTCYISDTNPNKSILLITCG